MISSTANSQLKYIQQLQKKAKARESDNAFICEGIKMLDEVRSCASDRIVKAYFTESLYNEIMSENREYFSGLEYETVTDSVFKYVSDTVTPQGVLAIVKMPFYSIEEMLRSDIQHLLILENLRDPGNLGTILRTAEAAGINGIILSNESVDMYNPKVIRSTMGAIFMVPFVYTENLENTINNLKQRGIVVYAAHLRGAVDYSGLNYGKSAAVLIGNEANGLSDSISSLADTCVKIPMEGKTESLNAAVAAALLMYELKRNRK